MQVFFEWLNELIAQYNEPVQFWSSIFSTFSLFVGWCILVFHHFKKKTVSLMGGKYVFKVKRRHFNSTDLTTIVSNLYFKGGQIDGELRQEIFKITGTTGIDLSNNEQ